MSETTMQDRELQDSELDLVSGGTDAGVLNVWSNYVYNVIIKMYGDAIHDAATKA